MKKLIAIMLTILMITTCLPFSALAATAPAVSGNTLTQSVTIEAKSAVCAVITVDANTNVAGLSFRLTGLGGTVTAKSASWTDDAKAAGATTYNGNFNYHYTETMGTLLCSGQTGYTFTKKTELIRIPVSNSGTSSATKSLKLVVDDFYDKNLNTVSSSKLNMTIEAMQVPTSFSITKFPDKLTYVNGTKTIDPTGAVCIAQMSDGTTLDVSEEVLYTEIDTAGRCEIFAVLPSLGTYLFSDNSFYVTLVSNRVEKLTITSYPKREYSSTATSYDLTGFKVLGTFTDESVSDVTDNVTLSAFPTGMTGKQTVTVTSNQNSSANTTFEINLTAPSATLKSISVTTMPNKTVYAYTDTTLETSGIKITATKTDNSTYDATGKVTYSGFTAGKAGKQTITVTSTENTSIKTTFEITVSSPVLKSISVTTMPNKTVYAYTDTTLETSGIKITAKKTDNSTYDATSKVTYSAFPVGKTGTQRITVTSKDNPSVTTYFDITITALTVTSIVITNPPSKKTYYPNDTALDTSDIRITGTYNNGDTFDATNRVTYSAFPAGKLGTQRITVTSKDNTSVTTFFDITINALSVTKLVIESQPNKTIYYSDDTALDTSGIKVTGTYNSGETFDATNKVTYSAFPAGKTGTQRITVTSKDNTSVSTHFDITVNALSVVKLDLASQPTKKTYYVGDAALDTSGIKVVATYNSGRTFDATGKVTYSGFNTQKAGQRTITVSLAGFTGSAPSFTVNVEELKVTGLTIASLPSKTDYFVGEAFVSSGLRINAAYNNGSVKDVTSQAQLFGYDSSKAGSQTITASVGGCTAVFSVNLTDVNVTGITVSTSGAKLDYFVGDSFDSTAIKVTASYNNGTKKDVSDSVSYMGFSSLAEGKCTVTVRYGSSTAAFDVNIKKPALTGISVSIGSAKTTYYTGSRFSPSGLGVVAHYENGSVKNVTQNAEYSGFDSSKPGKQKITVSYGGKSDSFEIEILSVSVVSISVTPPVKTSYYVGDALYTGGMTVTASFSNGTSSDVTGDAALSGFDSTSAGEKTVTVSYGGKTAQFKVKIDEVTLSSVSVTPPARTEYYKGDLLDPSGMKVTASYSNGEKADVTDRAELSGFDSSKPGSIKVKVSYGTASAEFGVTILDVVLESFTVTPPVRTDYLEGEKLDVSGMVAVAGYSNGTSAVVTDSCTVAGFDPYKTGSQTVVVSYGGKSSSFTVNVAGTTLLGITVIPPAKSEYSVGESFSADGMSVTANYSSGVSENVTDKAEISGFDSSKPGQVTVKAAYEGMTGSFEVTVLSLELTALHVTPPDKTEYFVGEELVTEGMTVTVDFSNGTSALVTKQAELSALDSSTPGEKVIKVMYGGFTGDFTVMVIGLDLAEISVTPPIKKSYYKGDEFSDEGMVVIASYTSGASSFVTHQAQIDGFDSKTPGEKKITVTFGSCTSEFSVFVQDVELVGISVKQKPSKTEYGFGEPFSKEGMAVVAQYSNDTSENITQRAAISGFDSTLPGVQTVKVTYGEMSDSFEVTVKKEANVVLRSLILTPPARTFYYKGDKLSTQGMSVIANYSDGTSKDVTADAEISKFDSSKAGEQTITVSFGRISQSFSVTVGDAELVSVQVLPPDKTEYAQGEEILYDEIRVVAYYSNGESQDVTDASVKDRDPLNDTLVTVSYGNFKNNILFTRANYSITGITFTPPEKRSYYIGDVLDTTGMKLEAVYSNGKSVDMTSKAKLSGFDSLSEGEQEVTATYSGFSDSFKVSVFPRSSGSSVTSLDLTPPSKTIYRIGDALSTDGMAVIASYIDGSTEDVTGRVDISGFDSSSAGAKSVTVSFGGQTASFEVTVYEGEPGDVNHDGVVDSSDALSILRFSVGFATDDDMSLIAADVNEDGSVDSADALIVLRKSLNM